MEGQGGSQPVSRTAGLARALFTVTAIRGPFGALIAFLLAFRHFLHYGARQRDDYVLLDAVTTFRLTEPGSSQMLRLRNCTVPLRFT